MKNRYVLLSAVRNEEKYVEFTLKSIVNQTVKPLRWIIVSDNSNDRTDEIVQRYATDNSFIRLIKGTGDPKRNFGSQIRAINFGYSMLDIDTYDFIGNVDGDVSFKSDYYEQVMSVLENEPSIGLAGGFIWEPHRSGFREWPYNSRSAVAHAIQLFKKDVFEAIGGYKQLKYGGADWYAEVMVRSKGFTVKGLQEFPVYHHKPILSGEGVLRGAFKQGLMDYSIGSHPVFEVVKCAIRVTARPYVLYALWRLSGYFLSYIKRAKREASQEFIRAIQKEQKAKLRVLQR